MTYPVMVRYSDEHARAIKRLPQDEGYAPFTPRGPAFTLLINNEPMAIGGFDYLSDSERIAWLTLSKDARLHPGVFWAIRGMVETTAKYMDRIVLGVNCAWPEAKKFAEWLGFKPTDSQAESDGKTYLVYARVR